MAAPLKRATAPVKSIKFIRPEDFAQGGGFPDGIYLLSNFQFVMFQATKRDGTRVGDPTLSVQITFEPENGATKDEERRIQNYSMGRNAHLTYQPDKTGKKLVLVPEGPAAPLYESTNWQIFANSINNSTTLPDDITGDDLSQLDGMVAHITNIDEPKDRAAFRAQSTSENDPNANARPRKIPVVMEVKSAPWEEQSEPVKAAPKAATTQRVNGKVHTPPPAEEPAGNTDNPLSDAIATLLEKNMDGMPRPLMRTTLFKNMTHPDKGNLINEAFGSDETLNVILEPLGYKVEGQKVVLA